ncbi:MAG: hypothetical protein OEU36_06500 [Gammaproteobacteria bacterium]|nr:hypothetical protein [Gammaproteobacteria bacterium]
MVFPPVVALILFALAVPTYGAHGAHAYGAHVRVTCEGIQEFSVSKPEVQCSDAKVLSDPDGNLVPGFSFALASLPKGRLSASSAGGSIRDFGYNGGEASALFKDTLSIAGEWKGLLPITVSLYLRYTFAGLGEARLRTAVGTRSSGAMLDDNRAHVRMIRKGFGGVTLNRIESTGNVQLPAEGLYQPSAGIVLSVTEMVHQDSPTLDIRALVTTFSSPNLGSLGSIISALVSADAELQVSIPGDLAYESASRAFLTGSYPSPTIDFLKKR